jgi:hypothetical protein
MGMRRLIRHAGDDRESPLAFVPAMGLSQKDERMVGQMNDNPRNRKLAAITVRPHKYAVGGVVAYRASMTGESAPFRITRLLPDGGQGFQYRIRSERDGHERVVLESNLERH